MVHMTGIMNSGGANTAAVTSKMGLFDSDNGFYLQYNNGVASFVRRSFVTGSVVETTINQTAWNNDRLNGTGTSGITLDFSKIVYLFTDMQSFCTGVVRLGFFVNGQSVLAHTFYTSNLQTDSILTKLSLPIRYEISSSTATPATGSMKMCVASVLSEGSVNIFPVSMAQFSATRDNSNTVNLTTSWRPVMSISLRPNETSGSLRKFVQGIIRINDINVDVTGLGGNIIVKIVVFRGVSNSTTLLNPAATAGASPVFAAVDSTNSIAQVDYTASSTTVDLTQGITVSSTVQSNRLAVSSYQKAMSDSRIYLGTDIDGNPDICTIFALSMSGTQTIYSSMNWSEYY